MSRARPANTLVDITERKRSEQRVEAAKEHIQGIFDTVREPLVVLDGKLRVQSASAAFYRAFQVFPEQTEGRLLDELGTGEWDIPELRKLLCEVLPENTIVEDFEVQHDFPSIGKRTMLLNARRIYEKAASTGTVLLAIEDITECKRAEEAILRSRAALELRTVELEALNAELEAFNYSVSHDLRTPLRGLDGFSRMLLEDYGDKLDESGKHYLERISAGAERMSNLLDSLLRLSRLTHARMKPREFNLSALAHAIVDNLRERDPERNVSADIEDDVIVYGDEELLQIVLQNLLLIYFTLGGHAPDAL